MECLGNLMTRDCRQRNASECEQLMSIRKSSQSANMKKLVIEYCVFMTVLLCGFLLAKMLGACIAGFLMLGVDFCVGWPENTTSTDRTSNIRSGLLLMGGVVPSFTLLVYVFDPSEIEKCFRWEEEKQVVILYAIVVVLLVIEALTRGSAKGKKGRGKKRGHH